MSIINTSAITAAWDNLMFRLDMAKYHFDENGVADLQTIIFGVAGAVVALIVAVIVLGNLDTATQGTINESSAYFALLETVNSYGSTSLTLLAIGVIVAGAAAILYIIRGSF
jgi:hypothetical protein